MKALVAILLIIVLALIGAGVWGNMQLQTLKKANAELSAQAKAAEELKVEADALKTEAAKLSEDLAAAQQAATDAVAALGAKLQGQTEALEASKAAAAKLASQQADYEKTKNLAESKLATVTQEKMSLVGKAADLEKKVTAAAEAQQSLTAKINMLTSDLADAKKAADAAASMRLTWKGILLLEAGDAEQALESFQAAFLADGMNAQATKGIALSHEATGDKAKAAASWESYLNADLDEAEKAYAAERIEANQE